MELSRRHLFTSAGLLAGLPALPSESESSRIWSPDSIRWTRIDTDGSRYAVLTGDRDKAGSLFSYAFWMPAGLWVNPHRHNRAAHVAVMSGELLLGFGERLRKDKTTRVRQGSFFLVEAGEAHFEGCAVDTLIIGTALGEWKTTEISG